MTLAATTTRIAIKNLLWATDFSPCSDVALTYALLFTRRLNAKLYLGHVVAPDLLQRLTQQTREGAFHEHWRDAERRMADLLASGTLSGLKHQVLISEGEMLERLNDIVRTHAIDLAILGTRGRTGLKKMLLGSVAEAILRDVPCPVMTIGPRVVAAKQDAVLKSIVCGMDFSPESLAAASYAFSLARYSRAEVVLLYAVEHIAVANGPAEEWRFAKTTEEKLEGVASEEVREWCNPEAIIRFSSPSEALLRIAEEKNADLIVLGSRRAETVAARLPGSTSYPVISNAFCPVLTVRKNPQS